MTHAKKRANAHRAKVERDYPHQVALPDDMCTYDNLYDIDRYCMETFGFRPPVRRVQAVWPDRKYEEFRLYCFAKREQSDRFAAHFEGEHFDPARDRENGKVDGAWRRTGEYRKIEKCGPLTLPDFWRRNR